MKEILFRGKREDNGEWVEGDFVHPCNIVFDRIGYDEVLKQDNVLITEDFKVIPKTVGQFTGSKDKNGKKIFEGDIVKCTLYDYEECFEFKADGVVEWNADNTCYYIYVRELMNYYSLYAHPECEVVGNIHDEGAER